jgi:tripartite-type tricarboxylate transporter receptor subunit TctC
MRFGRKGRFGVPFCLWLLLASTAWAQPAYPNRAVRIVVAFSPGGVTDIIARTLAPKLSELWGQPVVVENRTGAGGSIGAVAVARSPADGYTLLVHSSGYALNTAINPSLPYHPANDFIDVAPLASQPMVLVVGPSAGVASVAELIAAAKARPGHVNYGSAGIGSGAHFNSEKFRIAAGIEVVHVPYKGGAEAIHDTIAGRLMFTFNTITLALPHIRERRVVVLGVSSAQRSSLLPGTPTIAEAGVPGFEYTFWNGLWAPAGTPAPIVERIARDLGRVVTLPDVRERLASLGAEPMAMTPGEFARFVKREIEDSARVARAAGIRVQ